MKTVLLLSGLVLSAGTASRIASEPFYLALWGVSLFAVGTVFRGLHASSPNPAADSEPLAATARVSSPRRRRDVPQTLAAPVES
jgi:hypothetical protein